MGKMKIYSWKKQRVDKKKTKGFCFYSYDESLFFKKKKNSFYISFCKYCIKMTY